MGRRKRPTADELNKVCDERYDATDGDCEVGIHGCAGIGWCKWALDEAAGRLSDGDQ